MATIPPRIGRETDDDRLVEGESVVTWNGLDWQGFETILTLKGDRKYPRLLYDRGSLTFISYSEMQIPADDPDASPGEQAVTWNGLDWQGFETIVALKGDRKNPRFLYDRGSLTLVSPSLRHEWIEDRLDGIVKAICGELDVAYQPTGSVQLHLPEHNRSVEGDRTYYIANEAAIRGKDDINLTIDPPPDLAIEVEITHPARVAIETWRLIGTPEVWVYRQRGDSLKFLRRDDDGAYTEATTSLVFPLLNVDDVLAWLEPREGEPANRWERRLRAWVRDVLARRVRP